MVSLRRLTDAGWRWTRSSPQQKYLAIEAWFDLLIVAVWLRTPWHQTLTRARQPNLERVISAPQPAVVLEIVNTVAARHIKAMTCLERSLVARRMLRRRGVDVILRLGVSRTAGRTESHAWLEYDGKPLDHRAAEFVILRELNS